ncbi:MAG: Uma2 family endonuclease [Cyanobacteria bacterium P01_H01_bin.121]
MITAQRLTFEQYLQLDQGSDQRYELIDGRLVQLPPESEPNASIANYLFLQFVAAGISFRLLHPHACELQVPVLQPGDPANRYPDLVLLRAEHLQQTQRRLTITFDLLPPHLVVEVVSPGTQNRIRDYERKQQQYAARGVPEYWLVDPLESALIIWQLEAGQYRQFNRFIGQDLIQSPQLQALAADLSLTVEQIFSAVQ